MKYYIFIVVVYIYSIPSLYLKGGSNMKRIIVVLSAIFLIFFIVTIANATLVGYWDFNEN